MRMHRRFRRLAAGVALAALTVSVPVPAAAKKKPSVIATINGKRIKWRGRLVVFNYGPSGLIVVATKVRATKTIGFGCPIILDGQAFPVTMTTCTANYSQRKGVHATYWHANTGFQVTFDSFDGTTVQGSFSGSLPAAPFLGDGTTLTLQGEFRGPVKR